jgi:hypothetical protein
MRPTFASVTEIECSCGYLHDAANDPDNPITFDPSTNEFHLEYETAARRGALTLYHCPFCGGAGPQSTRDEHFARVPRREEKRLLDLFADVATIDDAISKFGPPETDLAQGVGRLTPESNGQPSSREWFRNVVFTTLSDVADVHVTDYHKDRVHVRLQGKYLGERGAV